MVSSSSWSILKVLGNTECYGSSKNDCWTERTREFVSFLYAEVGVVGKGVTEWYPSVWELLEPFQYVSRYQERNQNIFFCFILYAHNINYCHGETYGSIVYKFICIQT